jgi:hypothetical protein
VEFLVGDGPAAADEAAAAVAAGQQEEHELLEAIRAAFGAKHVVRVCGAAGGDAVLEGARRLLGSADALKRSGVDLSGASLAIDDCYEVWGSGFISIPYDFELTDLQPQLQRLLGAGSAPGAGGGGEDGGASVPVDSTVTAAAGGARRQGGRARPAPALGWRPAGGPPAPVPVPAPARRAPRPGARRPAALALSAAPAARAARAGAAAAAVARPGFGGLR